MKKYLLVISAMLLGFMACKKEKEAPAPEEKKYVYKRTPGDVTKIEGDVYVDTGGSVFTIKGKGFDPKRKKYYHLLLENYCGVYDKLQRVINLNGYATGANYVDTAQLVQITDSTLRFVVETNNLYSVRSNSIGTCTILDSIRLLFAVTSMDSSKSYITTNFDQLIKKKVKAKHFFNILQDTIHWYKNSYIREKSLTLDDLSAGVGFGDYVELYFNDTKINTGNTSTSCYARFDYNDLTTGDGFFLFDKDFYNSNKDLGLKEGFYNITMKERLSGIIIEERRGKKGAYVKFVD